MINRLEEKEYNARERLIKAVDRMLKSKTLKELADQYQAGSYQMESLFEMAYKKIEKEDLKK